MSLKLLGKSIKSLSLFLRNFAKLFCANNWHNYKNDLQRKSSLVIVTDDNSLRLLISLLTTINSLPYTGITDLLNYLCVLCNQI